jgi:exopolysaccharide biosynthesis polyprenyl glycosylphosphotransferase
MKRERPSSYVLTLYVLDILGSLLCLAAAEWLRETLPYGQVFEAYGGGLNVAICLMVVVIWPLVLRAQSAYDTNRVLRAEDELQTVVRGVAISTLVLAGTLYLSYRGLSRLLFLYFSVLDVLALVLLRLGARVVFKALGARRVSEHRILLAGAGVVGRRVAAALNERGWMGLRVVGFLDDDPAKIGQVLENHPVLGPLQEAQQWVRRFDVDQVIIALPLYAHEKMANLVVALNNTPANVSVVPDLFDLAYLRTGVALLGDMPLIALKEPALVGTALFAKRVLDLTIAVAALLLIWPAMVLIALCIKLDSPGPAIFAQERPGWHGKPFRMLKFRTMVVGADKSIGIIVKEASDGRHFLEKNGKDPRITRVGHLLRRWNLDELPQLFNVLKGEMSVVGPRPELPLLVRDYAPWEFKRFSVPPGITGWWQVTTRADAPDNPHTEADLYYILHYSLWLDLQILARTVAAVIHGKGLY